MKMGAFLFVISILSLAAWIAHQYIVWPDYVASTDYLSVPPEVWSSVFLSLAIAALFEGICRVRRASA